MVVPPPHRPSLRQRARETLTEVLGGGDAVVETLVDQEEACGGSKTPLTGKKWMRGDFGLTEEYAGDGEDPVGLRGQVQHFLVPAAVRREASHEPGGHPNC